MANEPVRLPGMHGLLQTSGRRHRSSPGPPACRHRHAISAPPGGASRRAQARYPAPVHGPHGRRSAQRAAFEAGRSANQGMGMRVGKAVCAV